MFHVEHRPYAELDTRSREEAARAARVLHPDRRPHAPAAAAPGADGRQPEGRRRQDDHHGQPRAALALHGVRVLVVDLDPQGNASTALGVEHRVGHAVGLRGAARRAAARRGRGASSRRRTTCWCVPATIDLAGAEIELVSMVARE